MQVSGIRESSRGGRTPRCKKPRHHQSLKDCANLDVPLEAWNSKMNRVAEKDKFLPAERGVKPMA